MTKTTIDVATVASLRHEEAMRMQAHELNRTLALPLTRASRPGETQLAISL